MSLSGVWKGKYLVNKAQVDILLNLQVEGNQIKINQAKWSTGGAGDDTGTQNLELWFGTINGQNVEINKKNSKDAEGYRSISGKYDPTNNTIKASIYLVSGNGSKTSIVKNFVLNKQ